MISVLLLLRKRFSPWNEILRRLVNTANILSKNYCRHRMVERSCKRKNVRNVTLGSIKGFWCPSTGRSSSLGMEHMG